MRQRPFPLAHGGANLCGNTLQPSRTATPRSQHKYERSELVNRPSALLKDIDGSQSPNISLHWLLILGQESAGRGQLQLVVIGRLAWRKSASPIIGFGLAVSISPRLR